MIQDNAEFNDRERTTFGNVEVNALMSNENQFNKKFKTKLEVFIGTVNAVTIDLIENSYENIRLKIDYNDRDVIALNIEKLDKPEFKNAICYVLGYLLYRAKMRLDIEEVGKIFKLISLKQENQEIEYNGVYQPDAVRYSILWEKINK